MLAGDARQPHWSVSVSRSCCPAECYRGPNLTVNVRDMKYYADKASPVLYGGINYLQHYDQY